MGGKDVKTLSAILAITILAACIAADGAAREAAKPGLRMTRAESESSVVRSSSIRGSAVSTKRPRSIRTASSGTSSSQELAGLDARRRNRPARRLLPRRRFHRARRGQYGGLAPSRERSRCGAAPGRTRPIRTSARGTTLPVTATAGTRSLATDASQLRRRDHPFVSGSSMTPSRITTSRESNTTRAAATGRTVAEYTGTGDTVASHFLAAHAGEDEASLPLHRRRGVERPGRPLQHGRRLHHRQHPRHRTSARSQQLRELRERRRRRDDRRDLDRRARRRHTAPTPVSRTT